MNGTFQLEIERVLIPLQVYDGLLGRANAAKADTEEALRGIKSNMKGMDDTLASLRGTTALAGPLVSAGETSFL